LTNEKDTDYVPFGGLIPHSQRSKCWAFFFVLYPKKWIFFHTYKPIFA